MNLFSTIGRRKIPGHKKVSLVSETRVLDINKVARVYFPLTAGSGAVCEPTVKAGEKVLVGTRIAFRAQMSVPLFSSVSGTVVGIEKMINVANGRMCDHIVIENDFKMEEAKPFDLVSIGQTREEIVTAIKDAGIVGLGGAGFPTWVKYNSANNIHTVLINAVECEPYLTTDFCQTRDHAVQIVEGARFLQKAAGAENIVIALKVKKEIARDALIAAAADYENIKVVEVPDKYPMGWEGTLIQQIFKKRYDKLPSEVGIIVNNAQTAIAVFNALVTGRPITKRLLTISGNVVNNPANILVPVGVLAEVVLSEFDVRSDVEFNLLPGGPMTSSATRDAKFAIQTIHGGLTLLEKVKFRSIPCLRCGECTAHCPVGLQPVEIKLAFEARDMVRLTKLEATRCVDCGLCSYVCPSKIEVADFVKRAKALVRAQAAAPQGRK